MRWKINKSPELKIVETSHSATPQFEIKGNGESGHETYMLVEKENNRRFFLKYNKKGKKSLTFFELMNGIIWNYGLPKYTPRSELVFDESKKTVGLVSHGLTTSSPSLSLDSWQRHHKFNDNTDYFSVAGCFVGHHVHQEDDGHRENIKVEVDKDGCIKYVKPIDFDMGYYGVIHAGEADQEDNKREGTDRDADKLEIVAQADIQNLPLRKVAMPHFGPGISRPLVKENADKKPTILNKIVGALLSLTPLAGVSLKLPESWNKKASTVWNTLLVSLRLKQSSKGFGESIFSDGNLTRQAASLTTNKKFLQWKWYHYARYLLIPRSAIKSELQKQVDSLTDPDDKKKAEAVKAALLKKYDSRREQFRSELLEMRDFVSALHVHKKEFLLQMERDDLLVEMQYGPMSGVDASKRAAMTEQAYEALLQEGLRRYPTVKTEKPAMQVSETESVELDETYYSLAQDKMAYVKSKLEKLTELEGIFNFMNDVKNKLKWAHLEESQTVSVKEVEALVAERVVLLIQGAKDSNVIIKAVRLAIRYFDDAAESAKVIGNAKARLAVLEDDQALEVVEHLINRYKRKKTVFSDLFAEQPEEKSVEPKTDPKDALLAKLLGAESSESTEGPKSQKCTENAVKIEGLTAYLKI
jgi:hypothetical protein